MSFGDNVFDYNVMLLKTRTFPTQSGVEKQPCYGVGRHSPVAAGGEADAAYLWAVGEAGAFELLGEEAAEEGAEPFAGGAYNSNELSFSRKS